MDASNRASTSTSTAGADSNRLPANVTLRKLSDTGMTVADPAEDIRGRTVVDRGGEEIGDVDGLLIDGRERKVRFVRVASGGFLGMGKTKFLIPVDAISRIEPGTVHVDQTREHVAAAPRYDPDLMDEMYEPSYYGGLYGHYGYAPYWGPGYVYPGYPYYRPM